MSEKRQQPNTVRTVFAPTPWARLREQCSPESIAYLKQSLERLERGIAPTPSFPLYGRTDSSLVDEVISIARDSGLCPTWLLEYEESRKVKFAPQGGIPKWSDIRENVVEYVTECKHVKYVDSDTVAQMRGVYRHLHCQRLSYNDTLQYLLGNDKIQERAAGWPEFQMKKTQPAAQNIALRLARNGRWREGYGYVFSRFTKLKNRVFFPMPFCLMVEQAAYFVPFLTGIQANIAVNGIRSPFVQWSDKLGFPKCFELMEAELKAAKLQEDEYIVYFSNDFKRMDTRTGESQYENIFIPVMGSAFGKRVSSQLFTAMIETCTSPIITPEGTIINSHGTASGAEPTNGGEGTCNDYFQLRTFKVMREKAHWRMVSRRVNGDDSIIIFFVKKDLPFEYFTQIIRDALGQVCEETGFDVQLEKLDISTTFGKFCQNVLEYDPASRRLLWCYPLSLVVNSIVNPERQYRKKDWDKDYRDIDIIVKADNAARHPAYQPFMEWLYAGTKYPLLGNSEEETQRILSKYESYRAHQSEAERYNRREWSATSSPTVEWLLTNANRREEVAR